MGTTEVNMAAEKLLSEAACKPAKAKATIYYLNDGAGLRMRIRPDGSRTWIYRYRLDGKEMSTGLGAYPTIGLQIARANAQEARLEVSRGNNPSKSPKSTFGSEPTMTLPGNQLEVTSDQTDFCALKM